MEEFAPGQGMSTVPHATEVNPGDKGLGLLPSSSFKLLAEWQGPFVVTWQMGEVNYEVTEV